MTPTDLLELHAQLAHTAGMVVEGFVVAAFLAFLWMVAPYFRSGNGRR